MLRALERSVLLDEAYSWRFGLAWRLGQYIAYSIGLRRKTHGFRVLRHERGGIRGPMNL